MLKEFEGSDNMKKITCPICGKELINLSCNNDVSEFWCDDCGWESIIVNDVDDNTGE